MQTATEAQAITTLHMSKEVEINAPSRRRSPQCWNSWDRKTAHLTDRCR